MKRLLVALALTCVLSGSALAGTIPTMGAPSPGGIPMTEPGEMPTVGLLLTIIDWAL